jgi:integrase
VVIDALAAHLAKYPATDSFVFATETGRPIHRTAFGKIWRRAAPGTHFHELRHYYASLLIRHGESVKVVQARLGHASASETLDTYSHLWPDSDDRTRTAVDSVLSADLVRTGEVINEQTPSRRLVGNHDFQF